jgi:hypothetical protein
VFAFIYGLKAFSFNPNPTIIIITAML